MRFKTQWGLLLCSAILINPRTFVFIFIVEIKYKRFSRGTARLHELQASPDLLRRDRLKLRLRNHFPGLYETSIICIPNTRCRAREIGRTKWPGGESLEPALCRGTRLKGHHNAFLKVGPLQPLGHSAENSIDSVS